MTPEKLRELEALREKATQGEWGTFDSDNPHIVSTPLGSDEEGCFGYPAAESADHPDGSYVIALHNAAPELFAAARRLEALEEAMHWLATSQPHGVMAAAFVTMLNGRADQILKERSNVDA